MKKQDRLLSQPRGGRSASTGEQTDALAESHVSQKSVPSNASTPRIMNVMKKDVGVNGVANSAPPNLLHLIMPAPSNLLHLTPSTLTHHLTLSTFLVEIFDVLLLIIYTNN